MITSVNNKDIINISKLKLKKYRDKSNYFLIEGIKLLEEAINNNIRIKKIYLTDRFDYKDLNLEKLNLIKVNQQVFQKLTSQKNPEGIIGVIEKKSLPKSKLDKKLILLDNIRDPGNLGTIIRTADAAGFNQIVCSNNCADLFNEKTIRSSMGSIFHIPVLLNMDLNIVVDSLLNKQFEVIGTSLNGKLMYLNQIKVPTKFALILGNESHGVSNELQNKCTQLLKLPIFGKAESLNVSIAAVCIC